MRHARSLAVQTPSAAPCHFTHMKVYTCTPKRFPGDPAFFARDSGLFCMALRSLGIESQAIMPGPAIDGDMEGLIRASMQQLEDPGWWRALELDGLIFYSWASPHYNAIAKAIQAAGVPFLVVMDTCGMISRLSNPTDWLREAHIRPLAEISSFRQLPMMAGTWFVNAVSNYSAQRRLPHYEAATKVAAVTPLGQLWIPNEARALGRPELVEKFCYLPHPQPGAFQYNGSPKENLVISVARWNKPDWPQKNPKVLVQSLVDFLKMRREWRGLIIGSGATKLPDALGMADLRKHPQLEFASAVPPADLVGIYQKAKIGFWASLWEGQQGTGAQALCCGCSVVAPGSSLMSCFRHYVSRGSGRLSLLNEPRSLANELFLEAQAWEQGHRDPKRISDVWCPEFHAPEVAIRALQLLGLQPPSTFTAE